MELLDRLRHQARSSTNSVRVRLVLLTVSLLIPAVLSMGFLLAGADRQGRAQTYQQMLTTARALSGTVDQQTAVGIAVVETLASDQALQAGDLKEFDARARRVVEKRSGWVVVTNVRGQQIVNTLRPYGAPLPMVQRSRQLTQALIMGQSRVSDLRVGRVAKRPVITVGARVDIKGQPHLVAYVVEAASFTSVFRQQRVPEGWVATLLDNDFKVIARSANNTAYTGHLISAQSQATLRRAREGIGRSMSLEVTPTIVAYTRSPQTGWTLTVAVSRAELDGAVVRSVALATSIFGLLLVLGIAMALFVSRGINRQVSGLVDAARAIGESQPVQPLGRSLEEVAAIHDALAAASRELKAREERQKVMINELNHRVKNTLATVQALARQTFGKQEGAQVETFTERLIALSAAHDLLTRTGWREADLAELMQLCLRAHGERITCQGPQVALDPHAAVALSMVFHELATNSAKYGALSATSGRVQLTWRLDDAGQALTLTWVETGGPAPSSPGLPGFGTRLIDSSIRRELKGASRFDYRPEGLVFEATLPTPTLDEARWTNPF